MAASVDVKMCSSCFRETKYECIVCNEAFCTRCTTFEDDEELEGWEMGRRVGYCDACLERVKSIKQVEDPDKDEDDEEEETEKELTLNEKSPSTKKKAGRKSQWSEESVCDLVDVIINDENYKRKLIFINMKNQKNTEIYKSVLSEVKERADARKEEFQFSVSQVRNKFKRCISACKTAALTIKTATGIARLQSEKGYGKWFENLFPLVKSRDSCQPEMALEPSAASSSTDQENFVREFVPVKSSGRKRKRKEAEAAEELLNTVKEAIEKDPMKDILNFMKEEMEKNREHEMQLVRMMMNQGSNREYGLYPNNIQGHNNNIPANMHNNYQGLSSSQHNFAGYQQSQGSLSDYQPFVGM